jgi:hypothetical protein
MPNTVGYGIHTARLKALVDTTPPLPQYVRYSNLQTQIPLPRLVSQVERSVVLVIASSEERNCESDFDVPIPDFGASAKSREQLQRERDDADRLARARAQREADERAKREQELRREEEERNRKRVDLARMQVDKIVTKLNSLRADWRDIQLTFGFKYFLKYVVEKPFSRLEDSSDEAEAVKLLRDYIAWATNNPNPDIASFNKSNHINARLIEAGRVSAINNNLGFFVVNFNQSSYVWRDIFILSSDGGVQKFSPSRSEGLRSSYVVNESRTYPSANSSVFVILN